MKVGFDGGIKLEFHDANVSSNGGLLAYRDLYYALGLFNSVSAFFIDKRTGRNIQHAIPTLLRQSIYSRLACYEDVNDAERLSVDPVMRAITGKKDNGKQAASARWVVSQPPRETYQNLSENCQAQQIRHVPDGRGCDGKEVVCRDIVSDRTIAKRYRLT